VTRLLTTQFDKYQSLLQYVGLATKNPFLEWITLNAYGGFNVIHDVIVEQEVIKLFLQHIQQNTTLKRLTLIGYTIIDIDAFVTFLKYTCIQVLEMDCLSVFNTNDGVDNRYEQLVSNDGIILDTNKLAMEPIYCKLGHAFCNNCTIQELVLAIDCDTIMFVIAVLNQIMYNTTMFKLMFGFLQLWL
jgi:hypothetical protein